MSESKTIKEWNDSIGLVSGMVFISNDWVIQLKKIENELITFCAVSDPEPSIWSISSFSQSYKLIFDPLSEKELPKMENTFKQTLQENTKKTIETNKEREYANFEAEMKETLLQHSLSSDLSYFHSWNELAERFCKENGLNYEYENFGRNRHRISWE